MLSVSLLIVGVVHPESSGLGGGGFMVVRHENGSVYSINFREAAPGGASPGMFRSNSTLSTVVCTLYLTYAIASSSQVKASFRG